MGISQTLENGATRWLKRTKGAERVGVSPRTFDKMLRSGLRHVKLPSGTILTKPEWVDAFIEGFEVQHEQDQLDLLVEEIVDDVLNGGRGRQ